MIGTIAALAAGVSAVLTALAAAFWWAYRRGRLPGDLRQRWKPWSAPRRKPVRSWKTSLPGGATGAQA